jgi:predicted dienelactone hydrolase
MRLRNLLATAACALTFQACAAAAAAPTLCEARWHDGARNRDVPIRIRMPAGTAKVPVILFSHGLGGSLDAGTWWAEAWAADGNAVIHLQHAGSDGAALRGGRLRDAMSAVQLRNRASDVRFVLDELARRPREGACDLSRIDRSRIGMSGHSFGAQTTLAIAGAHYPFGSLADARVRASVALSPQPAALADAEAFGSIRMPFLSITGSKDELPRLNQIAPRDRERPFRAMAPGNKYLLVMEGGDHRMFGGLDRRPDASHVGEIVVRATKLFWRATLRGDRAAKAELDRLGSTLTGGDRFERR